MCPHSQNRTFQSNWELLSQNQCMCLNTPQLNTSGYGAGRQGNMKMLAASKYNNEPFLILNSKLVKNTTYYFLPPKSGAPYLRSLSRITCIIIQIPQFSLNSIIHFLMNIVEPVLKFWGGRQSGWGVGAATTKAIWPISHFFSSGPYCFIHFLNIII